MKDEAAWLAMKSDWQAIPAPEALSSGRVRASLLRSIWVSRVWLATELLSFLFLGLVIVQMFWLRQFGAAVTLTLIAGFCAVASIWARSARLIGNMDSLRGMIDLTLSRARRLLRFVYGTYVVIAILLARVFTEGETPLDGDDRFLVRMTWLAFSLIVTVFIHIRTRTRVRRFESIRRSYDEGTDK